MKHVAIQRVLKDVFQSIADLVVKIAELPHAMFKRKGNDLIYVHKISLLYSLCAAPFEIESLDHRVLTVALDEIVTPSTKKRIDEEGMPICKMEPAELLSQNKGKSVEKGALWILFDIDFPVHVEEKNKKLLKELLA